MSDPAASQPDLTERVRRLELALADVQAQLARIQADALDGAVDPGNEGTDGENDESPPREPRDLEALVGTYWLSRIGVLALITGIAWFIALHFGQLGPLLRVVLGYALAGVLAGVGVWFGRSQRTFGDVVIGGGLAVAYFVTYALHFVASVRVVESESAGLVLLAAAVALIVVLAQRLGSETVAGIALFLGFHSTFLGESHLHTLVSTALIAAAAMYLLVKNRWVLVPLSSLIGVYVSHALGALRHAGPTPTRQDALVTLGFALLYFLLFATAVLVRPRQHTARMALAFSVVNGVAFVALGAAACTTYDRPLLLPFLALATALLLGSSWVARQRSAAVLVETHLALAVPVAAWASYEALPVWLFGPCVALGCPALVHVTLAKRLRVVPAVALTTIAAAAVALLFAGSSFAGHVSLSLACVYCVYKARFDDRMEWSRGVRIAGSVAAAACAMLGGAAFAGSALTTLAWVVAALGLVAAGLALRERALRLCGLAVLGVAAAKLLLLDLARLPTDLRILTFVASGAILLGLSFAYARYKDSLQRLL